LPETIVVVDLFDVTGPKSSVHREENFVFFFVFAHVTNVRERNR